MSEKHICGCGELNEVEDIDNFTYRCRKCGRQNQQITFVTDKKYPKCPTNAVSLGTHRGNMRDTIDRNYRGFQE